MEEIIQKVMKKYNSDPNMSTEDALRLLSSEGNIINLNKSEIINFRSSIKFKDYPCDQFFVNSDDSLCQKLSNSCYTILLLEDGTLFCDCISEVSPDYPVFQITKVLEAFMLYLK